MTSGNISRGSPSGRLLHRTVFFPLDSLPPVSNTKKIKNTKSSKVALFSYRAHTTTQSHPVFNIVYTVRRLPVVATSPLRNPLPPIPSRDVERKLKQHLDLDDIFISDKFCLFVFGIHVTP